MIWVNNQQHQEVVYNSKKVFHNSNKCNNQRQSFQDQLTPSTNLIKVMMSKSVHHSKIQESNWNKIKPQYKRVKD